MKLIKINRFLFYSQSRFCFLNHPFIFYAITDIYWWMHKISKGTIMHYIHCTHRNGDFQMTTGFCVYFLSIWTTSITKSWYLVLCYCIFPTIIFASFDNCYCIGHIPIAEFYLLGNLREKIIHLAQKITFYSILIHECAKI